jgi:hypothetical protein
VAPVTAWQAPDPAGRQEDGSSGHRQVLRDLAARLTAPDHQDRPGPKNGCVAIVGSVDLLEARRQRGCGARAPRTIQVAAGDDHVARVQRAPPGRQAGLAIRPSGNLGDRGPRLHRKAVPLRKLLKKQNELVSPQDPVGIGTEVAIAGHDGLQVGRVHAERVPALGTPGLADPATLQNAVIKACLLQRVTDAQSCPAGSDHHGIKDPPIVRQSRILPAALPESMSLSAGNAVLDVAILALTPPASRAVREQSMFARIRRVVLTLPAIPAAGSSVRNAAPEDHPAPSVSSGSTESTSCGRSTPAMVSRPA